MYKSSTVDGTTTSRKYIVDITGKLPTILCEIDTSDSSLKKSYVYADAQILAQREHDSSDPTVYDEYFYVHDRLGSVRMVVAATIDQQTQQIDGVETVNSYTYTPFGNPYDGQGHAETVDNPWQFTGQYHDAEINQYYLRARQYDPTMMRFMSRDPVRGKMDEPRTLHKYLYCINSPTQYVDPSGEFSLPEVTVTMADAAVSFVYGVIQNATYGMIAGMLSSTTEMLYGYAHGESYTAEEVYHNLQKGALAGAAVGAFTGGVLGPIANSGKALATWAVGGVIDGYIRGQLDQQVKDGNMTKWQATMGKHNFNQSKALIIAETWF